MAKIAAKADVKVARNEAISKGIDTAGGIVGGLFGRGAGGGEGGDAPRIGLWDKIKQFLGL